jgi:hypothetical protein
MKRGILPKPGIPKPILHGLRRTYTVRHRETFRTMYALDAPRRTLSVYVYIVWYGSQRSWIAAGIGQYRRAQAPARPRIAHAAAARMRLFACHHPRHHPHLWSDPPRCRSVSLCLCLPVSLSLCLPLSLDTLATATRDPRRSSITSPPAPAANLAPLAPLAPLECC